MITPNVMIWFAGISTLVTMLALLYTVHSNQKRTHETQAAELARLGAGLTSVRKQTDHLIEDHKSFKDDVSRSLERVYDKIGSVHDLVVQIALQKTKETP